MQGVMFYNSEERNVKRLLDLPHMNIIESTNVIENSSEIYEPPQEKDRNSVVLEPPEGKDRNSVVLETQHEGLSDVIRKQKLIREQILAENDKDIAGIYKYEDGHFVLNFDHGVTLIRKDNHPSSGKRGTWYRRGDNLEITWNLYGDRRDTYQPDGSGGWFSTRSGFARKLHSRMSLTESNLNNTIKMPSVEMLSPNLTEESPIMLYLGSCCEQHWELTYTAPCRDGPACSSRPGLAYDTSGRDLYHPSMQCEVDCVVHHDPLLPIDVILSSGYNSRNEFQKNINRMREMHKDKVINDENRPITASMSLEPHWRVKRRAMNKMEMEMIDMRISTNLNADIPVTRFSLLRLETDSYSWDGPEMWNMRWNDYMKLPENQPPKWESFDKDHVLSVVIGHCDGPPNYPKGYGDRYQYISALIHAGLPVYLTGRMNRCVYNAKSKKKPFWAKDKRTLIRKYKFHLAVENCDEKDWVTEKLYQTLMAGIVPLYVGSPNVFEFIPREAMVIAADFDSPKALADHLQYLANNEEEYEKYRSWRTLPHSSKIWKHFDWNFNHSTATAFCRICKTLHQHKQKKSSSGIESWGEYWKKNVLHGRVPLLSADKGWYDSTGPLADTLKAP